jgi:hypothetical protein
MKRGWALVVLLLVLLGCQLLGCQKDTEMPGPSVGSNSNWLTSCGGPVDCSAPEIPECACGVCTLECMTDDDCGALENARCAPETHAASRSLCATAAMSTGICLPRCEPGACGEGQACVNGACVTSDVDNAFCDEALPDEAARTLEDELLALANQRRTAGNLACPGADASMPQAELRFDPALSCAARTLAKHLATSGAPGVEDAEGRAADERAQLAGYAATFWYEGFAVDATSAENALSLILTDDGACAALADAQYLDIGVGNSAGAFSVIVAR